MLPESSSLAKVTGPKLHGKFNKKICEEMRATGKKTDTIQMRVEVVRLSEETYRTQQAASHHRQW